MTSVRGSRTVYREREDDYEEAPRRTYTTVKRYQVPEFIARSTYKDEHDETDTKKIIIKRERRDDPPASSRHSHSHHDDDEDVEWKFSKRTYERSEAPKHEHKHEHDDVDIRYTRTERSADPPRRDISYRVVERESDYDRPRARSEFKVIERDTEVVRAPSPPSPERVREFRFERERSFSPQRERPYDVERYSKSTEYFAQPQPQPIIIRQDAPAPQAPIIIREERREPQKIIIRREEPQYEFIERREVTEERDESKSLVKKEEPPPPAPIPEPEKKPEEDYFYERRVVERRRRSDSYDRKTEIRPRDSASNYSSDGSYEYVRRERRVDGEEEDTHHKRNLAGGAIAGIGAAEIIRHHRKRRGEEVGGRGRSAIGGAAVGALGAEALSRVRSMRSLRGSRSRSRSRSRSGERPRRRRHHHRSRSRDDDKQSFTKAQQLGGLAAVAAVGALAGYALKNRGNKETVVVHDGRHGRRSRSRRRRGSVDTYLSDDPRGGPSEHRDPDHRNRRIAQAGLASAAAAGILERVRSKSRGGNRSKSRVRQGVPIAAAGLGGAALAGLYEKNKANKEAKKDAIIEDEIGRGRRRHSRSRSRSRGYYDDGYGQEPYSPPGNDHYIQGNQQNAAYGQQQSYPSSNYFPPPPTGDQAYGEHAYAQQPQQTYPAYNPADYANQPPQQHPYENTRGAYGDSDANLGQTYPGDTYAGDARYGGQDHDRGRGRPDPENVSAPNSSERESQEADGIATPTDRRRSTSRVKFDLESNITHSPDASRRKEDAKRGDPSEKRHSDTETSDDRKHRRRKHKGKERGEATREDPDMTRIPHEQRRARDDRDNDSDTTVDLPPRFDERGNRKPGEDDLAAKINDLLSDANNSDRGEIAARIFQSARELDLETYSLYTEHDVSHIYNSHHAIRLNSPSDYMSIEALLDIAKKHQIDAIHPGYGFLSESPELAARMAEIDVMVIGPGAEILERTGDKLRARQLAEECDVPVLPALTTPTGSVDEVRRFAETNGVPIMVKAVDGGGGRGIRLVRRMEDLESLCRRAIEESPSRQVFAERAVVEGFRHVEVQILGDGKGGVRHLWERECSIQRRYQKIVEVSPSMVSDRELVGRVIGSAVAMARKVRCASLGTFEFLVNPECGEFFFLEVNPRLQVEHTITESICSTDIVKAQLRLAMGATFEQAGLEGLGEDPLVPPKPRSIQLRLTAEDPEKGYSLSIGKIQSFHFPSGVGTRVDTALVPGAPAIVTSDFDSVIAKIIITARTWQDAVSKARRALDDTRVTGIQTNLALLRAIVSHPDFEAGRYDTQWLESKHEELLALSRKLQGSKDPFHGQVQQQSSNSSQAIASSSGGASMFKKDDAWTIDLKPQSTASHDTQPHHLHLTKILKNDFPDSFSADILYTQPGQKLTPLTISLNSTSASGSALSSSHPMGSKSDPNHVIMPLSGKLVEVTIDA
ncbi:Pyruvate carboxylase [Fulvia fulva]|nr:Pyruvate carboxylase [Fulvia fulva]KAK4614450.1 Pyruvate carboxylase [Fulvia fulva]WPV20710.1 Pyruvate carboxylase [Fulvia fulva]WPV35048.1 Pyruvate carboxylase [Fulvia fulva]